MSLNFNFLRGPSNLSLDIMRLGAASVFVVYPFPFIWNVLKHGVVPDPMAWGSGYAAVIAAAGAAISAKDYWVAKAGATSASGNGS